MTDTSYKMKVDMLVLGSVKGFIWKSIPIKEINSLKCSFWYIIDYFDD
jgi:hypothetical protein